MKAQLLIFLALSALIMLAESAANPYNAGSTCVGTDYCPSYCTYDVDSANKLVAMCSSNQIDINSGGCTGCDPLFFTFTDGTYCIPHGLRNEYLANYTNYRSLNYRLGWYISTARISYTKGSNYQSLITQQVPGLAAHYAVRIRFSIYMYRNEYSGYKYPLEYGMDGTIYSYDIQSKSYWGCYDIVTSSSLTHYSSTLVVTWRNTNSDYPQNPGVADGYSDCSNNCKCKVTSSICYYCGCGNPCCHSDWGSDCCDNKYIRINDLLVFISKCTDNCKSCSSLTTCYECNTGYILNYADKLCYVNTSCPQATYKNSTMYQIGSYATAPPYTVKNMTYCVECNKTCLECLNSTYCYRCYTTGRNQSYLFNNTCVLPCYNGYVANMTNHTCDCPDDYHYQVVTPAIFFMWCYKCAFECVRCFGSTNLRCTQCQKGFYLANGTTHCLNFCPAGQFFNSFTQTCYLCDISCGSCVNSSTICTQCSAYSSRYLFGSQCLSWCPNGYSWNNITRVCDLCEIYTYSYQGKCIQTCPSMFESNVNNRTCIHYSKTSFTFNLSLQSVHVMRHGKLLQYTILLQDGINATSENWMKMNSYYSVQVVYGDSRLSSFVGVRTLQNSTLAIRNLNYSNNRITYTTNVPDYLDYHKSFQVVFLNTIYSLQGIKYNNGTNVYSVNQHPQLLKEYYTYTAQNFCDLILLPFFFTLVFLFGLYLKGTYEMFIEAYRVVQLLGVMLYSAFPVGSFTFYFLMGCSYTNFDFVPNLYAMVAKPDSSVIFASYFMVSEDMDFIRLMGSILLFGTVSLIVYVFCRFVLQFKEARLDYMSKLCIDIMEVKVFHSFWSSLLYIVSNYQESQFAMFMIFIFAIIFLGALVGRRYSIWKETHDFSPFFVWRAASTLLVCFVAMANEIVISLLVVLSLGVTLWQFFLLHSSKYLVNINSLNSANYMEERTYKVLNNYDLEVSYSFSISFRNIIITLCPFLSALVTGVLILLRDEEYYSIFLSTALIYVLLLLVVVNAVFIFLFLRERRRFLVQNKLEYLQKKYTKLGNNDTQILDERRRPRQIRNLNFEEEKYLEADPVNRNMIKSFD